MAFLGQGGLRDARSRLLHERGTPRPDSLRQAYARHVTNTLERSPAQRPAAALPRRMRNTSHGARGPRWQRRRSPAWRCAIRKATDHPTSLATLHTTVSAIDWTSYFRTIGLESTPARVNLSEPAFFKEANHLLVSTPVPVWKAYLRYHLISAGERWLSTPFVNEDFAYTSLFTGREATPAALEALSPGDRRRVGEALGKAYVDKTFPPEAKARAKEIIDDVRAAFAERLRHLTWMSDTTRQKALAKLAQMHEKVGYPDVWRDYSKLEVAEGPFVLNVFRADQFEWHRVVGRPGSPVDTTEWGMTVPTVNAYYDGSKNEMVFPAGALEPQTFDPKADDGANFGSLAGSWAGHELTHGFDDEGRHFDAKGNLTDWWTATDGAKFTTQADLIVKQFNSYVAVDTLHVNGKLTEGENIADFGGILTGYDALERALEQHGRPGLYRRGFTPEQRFFLGYAP